MEQELSDALIVLSDRLGVAAENVFDIFVGAQPLVGVVSIAATVLGIVFAFLAMRMLHRYLLKLWKNDDGEWMEDSMSFWEPFIVAVVFVLCILVFCELFFEMGEDILMIVEPEYMASREIIGILKP